MMHAIRSAGFEVGRAHRHNMHEIDPDDYTHFVVMVREPIIKSISNYFESKRLIDISEEIDFTLGFFEEVVYPLIGRLRKFNQFHTDPGWTIYPGEILVIRVEDFNTGLQGALSCLLQHPADEFELTHHPMGVKRFDGYTQFIEETIFFVDYLERVSQSEYCQKYGYEEDVMEWMP